MSAELQNARAHLHRNVVIAGTGFCHPSDLVDNEAFFARCEFPIADDREGLVRETRMQTRTWCAEGEDTWTLARDAARMAVREAGVGSAIDVILVSSCSTIPGVHYPDPDNPVVADLAPLLADDLGVEDAVGIDLKATYCAGFVRGLQVLDGLLQNPNYRAGLLVCSDVGGRFATAPSNRSAFCFLVGDAAGAVVLRAEDGPRRGLIDYTGTLLPKDRELTAWGADGRSLVVRGSRAGEATMRLLLRDCGRLLARNQLDPSSVDWLLPMQTHAGAVDHLASQLGWPRERVLWFGDRTGYAASASIPATLARMRSEGVVQPGDLVLCPAVGAGMNSGAVLFAA